MSWLIVVYYEDIIRIKKFQMTKNSLIETFQVVFEKSDGDWMENERIKHVLLK